mgnify:CR=1 FL=1
MIAFVRGKGGRFGEKARQIQATRHRAAGHGKVSHSFGFELGARLGYGQALVIGSGWNA